MAQIFVETSRLILRQWIASDLVPFAEMTADKEVMEFFPSTLTGDEAQAFIKRLSSFIDENGFGFFAAERKDNDEFIGFTGLSKPGFESFFTPCVEIGWRLNKASWGQGFATEAATACLNFGFDTIGLNDIFAFTAVLNKKSERVMQKIGMKKAGEFAHPAIPEGHILKPHVVYQISRPDFKVIKNGL